MSGGSDDGFRCCASIRASSRLRSFRANLLCFGSPYVPSRIVRVKGGIDSSDGSNMTSHSNSWTRIFSARKGLRDPFTSSFGVCRSSYWMAPILTIITTQCYGSASFKQRGCAYCGSQCHLQPYRSYGRCTLSNHGISDSKTTCVVQ